MSTQSTSYPQGFVDHAPVYDNAKCQCKRKRKRKQRRKGCGCSCAAKLPGNGQ